MIFCSCSHAWFPLSTVLHVISSITTKWLARTYPFFSIHWAFLDPHWLPWSLLFYTTQRWHGVTLCFLCYLETFAERFVQMGFPSLPDVIDFPGKNTVDRVPIWSTPADTLKNRSYVRVLQKLSSWLLHKEEKYTLAFRQSS